MPEKTRLLIAVLIPLLIVCVPGEWIPLAGLTVVEHRLIAIFALAALFWVLEPIPIFATSLLIILLELVLVSDSAFVLFRTDADEPGFGTLLSYQDIMATFASPIILLFLGGFFLAMAATKYRLDLNLARILLKPFGTRPPYILLGLMLITSVFSMFMSNTATTAMMLAILTPVLASFDRDDPARIAFVLAIPFAANVGGIGTPIGTPPNAIALQYLTGDMAIGFGEWMAFAVPFALVLLLITWGVLCKTYPARTDRLALDIKGTFLKNWKAITVYGVSTLTIVLWLFDFLHGMKSYVVAMIPVAIFTATRIITTEDLKRISWDVLWLVSGGIALGLGLEESGLARRLIESIPFASFPAVVIVLFSTLLAITMASLMSNTATANLILPLVAALGASLPGLETLGGEMMVILVVTMACSLAMPLPISTPPNAMAHATGLVESRQMARSGLAVGAAGLVGAYLLMFVLNQVGFF